VDLDTFELYGHIVASDIFQTVYVMPMAQIFEDIRERFDAASVDLADGIDIVHARTVASENATPASALSLPYSDGCRTPTEPNDSGYVSRWTSPATLSILATGPGTNAVPEDQEMFEE
jgi:hypothetical protein